MPQLRNLSSYHHTDSLLIQFVLDEFLMTMQKASQLSETLLQPQPSSDFDLRLKEVLLGLSGSEQDYGKLFSWVIHCGVLTKLKHNATLLMEGDRDDADLGKLHSIVTKAYTDCQAALHLPTIALCQKAIDTLGKLKPVIKKILVKFKEDENVLFFVLRHQKSLNKVLGNGWTKSFFTKLYPEGGLTYLKSRFETRGFNDLIPDITKHWQELSS